LPDGKNISRGSRRLKFEPEGIQQNHQKIKRGHGEFCDLAFLCIFVRLKVQLLSSLMVASVRRKIKSLITDITFQIPPQPFLIILLLLGLIVQNKNRQNRNLKTLATVPTDPLPHLRSYINHTGASPKST
jgi:hypothetical protein